MTDERSIDQPLTRPALTVDDAAGSRYLLLRTFRSDGSGVDTPIWFVLDATTLWFRTPTASAKVRRMQRHPGVELRLCDYKGVPLSDAVLTGQAFVADDATARQANGALADRYGWQWNIAPMIPLPGVKSAHRHLGVRERIKLMRSTELWAESSIIGIEISGDR